MSNYDSLTKQDVVAHRVDHADIGVQVTAGLGTLGRWVDSWVKRVTACAIDQTHLV